MALTELVAHAATSRGHRAPRDPAGLRRLLGRVRPGPALAALRARPVAWASGCRSRPSPGRDWGATRMSGTGSPPPPTAGSGCCAPPTPSRSANWPEPAGSSRPRPRSSAACGATKAPPASSTPGPSIPASPARLDTGQAGYIHGGGCTWVQIARPQPSPLPLPPPPARAAVVIPPPARKHDQPRPPPPRRPPWMTRSARRPARDRPARTRSPRSGCPPARTCPTSRSAPRGGPSPPPPTPTGPTAANPAAYAAASAAYATLRTPWGRSEAYADLAATAPARPRPRAVPPPAPALPRLSPGGRLLLVPARVRHGRPGTCGCGSSPPCSCARGRGTVRCGRPGHRGGGRPALAVWLVLTGARGPGPATRPVNPDGRGCARSGARRVVL